MVSTFLTLDGVMQAPGGPEEDPTGGFAQGGWSVNSWDEGMGAVMAETLSSSFELLLGRRTYEIFAADWPHVSDQERPERDGTASDVDDPAAEALNRAMATYRRAGAVHHGSFALEKPTPEEVARRERLAEEQERER